jgi:hypothetical protein
LVAAAALSRPEAPGSGTSRRAAERPPPPPAEERARIRAIVNAEAAEGRKAQALMLATETALSVAEAEKVFAPRRRRPSKRSPSAPAPGLSSAPPATTVPTPLPVLKKAEAGHLPTPTAASPAPERRN